MQKGTKIPMARPKYYTPNEVSVHNTLKDLWISFLGKVYDLTPLCQKHGGLHLFSSYFDKQSCNVLNVRHTPLESLH